MANPYYESALTERAGVEQPMQVNPHFKRHKKVELTVDDYVKGILNGDRTILSRAITMIESENPTHIAMAQDIIERCLPHSGNSLRIGITGVPGVGKSTFIESFGGMLTAQGHKLAVLAIDPSSERTKGSILGDKTRMETLSVDPNAFIRPSPSGSALGGVARKTRESIILCEAAGFDTIIVETVGVGQSETVVKSMVDFFLLLMLAGAGDELQGIKRGIMEMADALVINKADGDNLPKAKGAASQYRAALKLFPKSDNGWEVPVEVCSARECFALDKVWQIIQDFVTLTKGNGSFDRTRNEQLINIFYHWIEYTLHNRFYNNEATQARIDELIPKIQSKQISPYMAAAKLTE
ncbi:MAG: methylmalonyl Co-A mutase-associated GTPase MeaB [Bacteroidales bacterium]|nr:methylmalonyl Co-A mutase-associated GTPase MeaB [Bacteroidales bacterium]MDD6185619.1 methylmalonyl Co-A mutase-associated GTPase MeaB [Bacteroidales bacterium]